MKFKILLNISSKIVGWIGIILWVTCYSLQAINGHPMPEGIDQLAIMSLITLKFTER